jgi:2-methylcitrate dehydratase PrpD
LRRHGWHATGTLGSLGAAAAAANLMGLDAETTARALGIATTQAAGLKSQFGTMCKPLHAGHAAMTGLTAARLAAKGFTSRTDMLETEQGLAATQSTTASEERFEKAMRVDSYVPDICFKYHAACYLTHSAIEATRRLVEAHGLTPNDVDHIELTVDPGHFRVCNIQAPSSGLEAKFSLRFTTAMALAGEDTAGIDSYTEELTQQADLVALRDKVKVTAWGDPNPETRVRIRAGGSEHAAELNVGIPNRDLDEQWTKLTSKCLALTGNPSISDACRALGQTQDLSAFFELIRGSHV